jgi:hypothetical protein
MAERASERTFDLSTADGVAELEVHVQYQLSGRLQAFRLVVKGQGIVLRGHAHTYHAKQLAQHTVMGMTALPILANEIEVS